MNICTKDELKSVLKEEEDLYFTKGKLSQKLVYSKNARIFLYQKFLRCEEYYGNTCHKFVHKLLYIYYKRKKNRLGQQLGFDIPINCFDRGLRIYHVGNVVVNADARIGKNCRIFGNVCIGVAPSGVPVIGDNCIFGYGSTAIGGIYIANESVIGAGSVLTENIQKERCVVAGVPAKII